MNNALEIFHIHQVIWAEKQGGSRGETQVKSEGKSCGKRAERINSKFCCANMGNCANIERKYPAAFDAPV